MESWAECLNVKENEIIAEGLFFETGIEAYVEASNRAAKMYAEQCCLATLDKVAINAKCIHMGEGFYAGIDVNTIRSRDNVVIL